MERHRWRVNIIPTQVLGAAQYTIYLFDGTDDEAMKEAARFGGLRRPFIVERMWVRDNDLILIEREPAPKEAIHA